MVFTLPRQLADLVFHNKRILYGLLFRASADSLLEFTADFKHLGAEIGFLSVLHTWGQNLVLHPHVHCVIPAGGLSLDHTAWLRPRYRFFLPVKALGIVFRGKFVDALERAYRNHELCLPGALKPLAQEKAFRAFVRSLHQQDWVVYAKPPFGGPQYVLPYLARYTHRVAISNHRLVAFADGKVTFRWKDYADDGKQRLLTLTAEEFLRRFLQHVLPPGFVRIRFFGFLSPRKRGALLPLCRQRLKTDASSSVPSVPSEKREPVAWTCPLCGGPMMLLERLDAWPLQQEEEKYFDTSCIHSLPDRSHASTDALRRRASCARIRAPNLPSSPPESLLGRLPAVSRAAFLYNRATHQPKNSAPEATRLDSIPIAVPA